MRDEKIISRIAEITSMSNARFGDKIVKQKIKLHSYHHNLSMQFIEEELNKDYVKTRMLEEIDAYTRSIITEELHSKRDTLKSIMKEVESTKDSLVKDGFFIKEAPFDEKEVTTYYDRDGSIIEGLLINNDSLSLGSMNKKEQRPSSISVSRDTKVYKSNDASLGNGAYRTFYMSEAPATEGVNETITLSFSSKVSLTNIELGLVNVDRSSIAIINNGERFEMPISGAIGFPKTEADKIEIKINDRSYRKVVYEYDDSRNSENFWDKVGDYQQKIENNESAIFDLEAETGMARYKKELEEYQIAHAAWKAEKERIERENNKKLAAYEQRRSAAIASREAYNQEMAAYNKAQMTIEENLKKIEEEQSKLAEDPTNWSSSLSTIPSIDKDRYYTVEDDWKFNIKSL